MFVVSVASANDPPVITPLADSVALIGQLYELPIRVSDLDEEPLTFDLSGLPPEATITAGPGIGRATLSWTPSASDAGTHTVTVRATDGGNGDPSRSLFDEQTFTLRVRADNQAPTLDEPGLIMIVEGQALTLQLSALDPDGDALGFSADALPSGAHLDPLTGLLTWEPNFKQAGTHTFAVTASDGVEASTRDVTIEVGNTNFAPRITPLIPQLGREGSLLEFTITGSDLDGDSLAYSVLGGLPIGAGFNTETQTFFWTPGFDQAGDHSVVFAVQDPSGDAGVAEVLIKIANVNRAPQFALSNHAVRIGQTLTFDASATDPDADDVLTYAAAGLPDGATVDADTGLFVWTPGPGQIGDHVVSFEAFDGFTTRTQSIVIRAAVDPAGPDVRVELTPSFPGVPGAPVLITPAASGFADVAGTTVSVDGVALDLDDQGRATFVPDAPGRYDVQATATDIDGLTTSVSKTLLVRDPADVLAPQVSLDPSVQSVEISGPLAVIGSVVESNLDRWELTLRSASTGQVVLVIDGHVAFEDAVLTTLDPQTLPNGGYTLTLSAVDISGRRSSTQTRIDVNTPNKVGLSRTQIDASVTLGGNTFDLTRVYHETDRGVSGAFGLGWRFTPREVRVELDTAPTGQEALGVYTPLQAGNRVYLTLPDGLRTGFTFRPTRVDGVNVELFTPMWSADDPSHGFTLASARAVLIRGGSQYYVADTGQPYHPGSGALGNAHYRLTAPDGTVYVIQSQQGVIEQIMPSGERWFYSDTGVVSGNGDAIRFIQDDAGQVASVALPDGGSLIYTYDDAGQLVSVRDLTLGQTRRYLYDADAAGLLTAELGPGGGTTLGDGTPTPVLADLGGFSPLLGQDVVGTTASPGPDLYALTVAPSELASVGEAGLLVRVVVDSVGAVVEADLRGAALLSDQADGDRRVRIFSVTESGTYLVALSSPGSGVDYQLRIAAAGDVSLDGRVDGQDGVDIDAPGTPLSQADIDGSGEVDATDRQLLAANLGFLANSAPVVNANFPAVLTHVDLPVAIDLDDVASDFDGDRVYYRVVDSINGQATLAPGAGALIFTPTPGFDGVATVDVMADDGINSTDVITLTVNVSNAPLIGLDFTTRVLSLDEGQSQRVQVVGDFADQQDVLLPLEYLTVDVLDPDVAMISSLGVVTGTSSGSTALVATRGSITVATAIGVGDPVDNLATIARFFGIDAYPDAVTIVPDGGTRQVVVTLGTLGTDFVSDAVDGTIYFAENSEIVTVTEDGLIEAVAEGATRVTVIHRGAEEVLDVVVEVAVDGPATIGEDGGVVRGDDGTLVAFGPGQLAGDAQVTVTAIDQPSLEIPAPPVFEYAAAFNLDIQGPENTGPVQVAVPVDTSVAGPGDTVYFFEQRNLFVELENGDRGFHDVWAVVESGVVDDDGIARTSSPPFPGLSKRGNVLVARSNQPSSLVIVDPNSYFDYLFIASMGVAAASRGLVGASAALRVAGIVDFAMPIVRGNVKVQAWREFESQEGWENVETEIVVPEIPDGFVTVSGDFPPLPASTADINPELTSVELITPVDPNKPNLLKIKGNRFFSPERKDSFPDNPIGSELRHARVVFEMGGVRVTVEGSRFIDPIESIVDDVPTGEFLLEIPRQVLIVGTDIFVEQPPILFDGSEDVSWLRSQAARIVNKQGFGFVANGSVNDIGGPAVEVINLNTDTSEPQQVVRQIDMLGAQPQEVIATLDRSRVFVSTNRGVGVIDATTLQLFDLNPMTAEIDLIDFGNGESSDVAAMAMDPSERYLYVVTFDGRLHIVDIQLGSKSIHEAIHVLSIADVRPLARSIAVDSLGRKLYVAAPFSLDPTQSDPLVGPAKIFVVNVDPADRNTPGNPNKWGEVIYTFEGLSVVGQLPNYLTASPANPNNIAYTDSSSYYFGFNTIHVTNEDPKNFQAHIQRTQPDNRLVLDPDLVINSRRVGRTDLNIKNAAGLAITPDGKVAFVADRYLPRSTTHRVLGDNFDALFYDKNNETGSKIGVILEPFGDKPRLIAATTPIPHGNLLELTLSPDGSKLYANFSGIGNIAIYDVKALISRAKVLNGDKDTPIDRDVPNQINLEAIDVSLRARHMALQPGDPITLLSPTKDTDTTIDIHNNKEPLVFRWKIDSGYLMSSGGDVPTELFVSALPSGSGLWPEDAPSDLERSKVPDPVKDNNPGRIFSKGIFLPGRLYAIDTAGVVRDLGEGVSGEVSVTLDPGLAGALTAGQDYFWGVRFPGTRQEVDGMFRVPPVKLDTPFNGGNDPNPRFPAGP